MKLELVAYGILLVGLLFIGLLPLDDNDKGPTQYCHIDSISLQQKYTTIPEVRVLYYTPCGVISTNNNNLLSVGDSIGINFKFIKK